VVVDDGLSRNGSFLNGARIRGRRRLVDGDELRFGRTRLVYHAPPRRPSAAARSVGQLAPDELRVLIELARPRRADALAAPATDTTIACALDLGLAVVRDMIARACVELRIDTADGARARARLADALLAWDVREGPTT
ncbi:MAG: FHA domain-containing protein, partial [Solirubrobacteraceae bacterium]